MTLSHPSFVGFDSIFDRLDRMQSAKTPAFPPHNIVKFDDREDDFMLELALAGYSQDDIELKLEKGVLTIGTREDYANNDEKGVTFLYKGISAKKFRKQFTLADNIEVEGASMENGILYVHLHKVVPDEEKPRYINISNRLGEKSSPKFLTEN
jgi:molecular chaperone IbpA